MWRNAAQPSSAACPPGARPGHRVGFVPSHQPRGSPSSPDNRGGVWVEFLIALIVEGYREIMEWWQTRASWRHAEGRADEAEEPAPADDNRPSALARDWSSGVEGRVAGILDRHAQRHVGVEVGVWWEGETWTFARGRLGADRPEPPGPDTIFEIGSITKVFTATLLADIAEEGLVALDDPVQRYLPKGVELPIRRRPITLADLAAHTSGLPRLPKGLVRLSLKQRRSPYAGFTDAHLERAVVGTRLRGRPGEKARYSNFGFGLLGYVLALRTGQSYEQLVRERICTPLRLVDTGISIPAVALPRFADGHNRRGQEVLHWDMPTLAGAGALRSTVVDLLRFLGLQLRQPTTRLGHAAWATHEARARRGRLSQGLGWASLPLLGHSVEVLWHNGGTGGFRGFVGFVRERGTGVVVLSNCARSVDAIGFRTLEAIN
jgi:serine-type D-Ala-D-Ala carboxypeptidase/endopeptidase